MKIFPHILATIFIPFWIYWAIEPYNQEIWIAENLPVIAIFLTLVLTYKHFKFSNTSYILMSCWLLWHTVGGHYTFEKVPFDAITDFFHFERNHFDRIGHLFVGFFAYPIAEFTQRKKYIKHTPTLLLFALFAIVTIAAFYEIIEWIFAIIFDATSTGGLFLGSQGDIWDAQKDILLDTLGAIFSLALFQRKT